MVEITSSFANSSDSTSFGAENMSLSQLPHTAFSYADISGITTHHSTSIDQKSQLFSSGKTNVLSRLCDAPRKVHSTIISLTILGCTTLNTHHVSMLSVLLSEFPECHFTNTARKMKKIQQQAMTQQTRSPRKPPLISSHHSQH